ncbi:MAG: hypothetical protein KGJ90_04600 [Patescibacteria group bacterium]|nr:hypothetical protein [Patescibacteria group bacterium]
MVAINPTYFPTPNNGIGFSASITPWSSGIILPLWPLIEGWSFFGSGLSELSVIPGGASYLATEDGNLLTQEDGYLIIAETFGSLYGFPQSATDSQSGAWLVQYSGDLINVTSGAALNNLTLPAAIFTGCAYSPSENAVYVISASGQLYVASGASMVAVGSGFAGKNPAWSLISSGATLYTLLAGTSNVGVFNLSSSGVGASGILSPPITYPACLAVASGSLAVGGWQLASIASGFKSISTEPTNPNLFLTAASGTIGLWNVSGSSIVFNQSITGLTNPSFIAWGSGSSTLAMACDGNNVYDLQYNLSTLTINQTIPVTGAVQVAITPAGDYALVTQTSLNQVSILANSGTWAISGTLTVGTPYGALTTSASGIAIGYSSGATSGISFATLTGSTWTISNTASLGFIPRSFALDNLGNIYAVGAKGSTGHLAVVSGTSVVASGVWLGSANSVIWKQGQITVADNSNGIIRIFGPQYSYSVTGYTLTQYWSGAVASGLATLGFAGNYLLASASGITWEYEYGAPYNLQIHRNGLLSVYNGSSWSTANLGDSNVPEAVAYDPSGNVSVATLNNYLFTVSTSGTILSQSQVTQQSGQSQTVPIGMSSLLWLGGHLYASTSLNDSLLMLE